MIRAIPEQLKKFFLCHFHFKYILASITYEVYSARG